MNLRDPKRGSGLIALAGPVSNLLLALVFGIIFRVLSAFGSGSELVATLAVLSAAVVQVNVSLALFNLLPIPPLDGSGVLFSLLPHRFSTVETFLTRYGFYVLLALIITGAVDFLAPIARVIFLLFIGGLGN